MNAVALTVVVAGCMLFMVPPVSSSPPDEGAIPKANDGSDDGPFRPDSKSDRAPTGAVRIAGEKLRDWKDAFGNSMRGRLLGLSGATIVLQVEDEPLVCALALFSLEDREYVRSVLRSCGQADLFPGVSDPRDEAAKLALTKPQWQTQLERWNKAVMAAQQAPREAEAAWKHLRNVRDANALEPLATLTSRRTDDAVRTACVEAIAGIGSPEAVRALVKLATTHASGPVRASAVWALCYLKDPLAALDEFARYLRVDRFRDPALICLRATGLVRPLGYKDPPPQIVKTLIDILWVQERVAVPYYYWSSREIRTPKGGYSGHFHYHKGLKWFPVPLPCEMARKTLVEASGQDYGYDRQAWRRWYEERQTTAATPERDIPGGPASK
jgi:hypothetical protein